MTVLSSKIYSINQSDRATGNSRFENAKREKFPFSKMIDFARSNTISTQTSDIESIIMISSVCRSVGYMLYLKS